MNKRILPLNKPKTPKRTKRVRVVSGFLSKYPSLYKTLNVLQSSIRYKLKCVDEEGTEITQKVEILADKIMVEPLFFETEED